MMARNAEVLESIAAPEGDAVLQTDTWDRYMWDSASRAVSPVLMDNLNDLEESERGHVPGLGNLFRETFSAMYSRAEPTPVEQPEAELAWQAGIHEAMRESDNWAHLKERYTGKRMESAIFSMSMATSTMLNMPKPPTQEDINENAAQRLHDEQTESLADAKALCRLAGNQDGDLEQLTGEDISALYDMMKSSDELKKIVELAGRKKAIGQGLRA